MAPEYELYTYFRSSCSARVRIAAHWKGIDLKYHFVHLVKDEQKSPGYVQLNPSRTVPTLVVHEGDRQFLVRQSVAILEFFEERHPELPKLLPSTSDVVARATVRDLVNIIACDVQPVTNLKVLNKVKASGVEANDWQQSFMKPGLEAYETIVRSSAGKYSVGEEVTMADVVLLPAVDGAMRFKINIEEFPTIKRIYEELTKMDAFQKGGWKAQPDTPAELR